MTGIVRIHGQTYHVTPKGWAPMDEATRATLDAAEARRTAHRSERHLLGPTAMGKGAALLADADAELADDMPTGFWVGYPNLRTSWAAPELMAATFPPARFAVPDLIPDGLTFFAGAPKLGKSWLALGLGIAVASGGRALGSIQVDGGDVLYLALEDGAPRLQRRIAALLDGAAPPRLQLETAWPRLGSGGAEAIEAWVADHPDTRLVVVDVFTRIRSSEVKRADLYRADYDAAVELQSIAIRSGVAVVCIYHTRKTEDADFVAMMTGTFGLAAGADTILVARRSRGEADATLYVTGRDIEERELAMRFAPSVGTWTILGDAAVYALGETRRDITEAIRIHGTLTPKRLSEVTDIGYENARQTMRRMANDGQLVGRRGSYSLAEEGVTAVTLSPVEDPEVTP